MYIGDVGSGKRSKGVELVNAKLHPTIEIVCTEKHTTYSDTYKASMKTTLYF
jgi:hypothetical protein